MLLTSQVGVMQTRCAMSSGGRREGAGRPSKGQVVMTIRVSPEVAAEVRRRARGKNMSIGDVFAEGIKEGCRE